MYAKTALDFTVMGYCDVQFYHQKNITQLKNPFFAQ